MDGFIKLHKKLSEWQWLSSPKHLSVFVNILIRCNYKESEWRSEKLQPGQILTGRKQLSTWTGLNESAVYRVLKDLEKSGEVNIKKTTKYSIITVTNWAQYQASEQQMNNKRTTDEQQMNTSKKEKKEKKEKNIYVGLSHDIIDYLNKKTGKAFKHSKTSENSITPRLKEGYTVEQLKKVIDIKTKEWLYNDQMNEFLCPATLFRASNFEKYLNQTPKNIIKSKTVDKNSIYLVVSGKHDYNRLDKIEQDWITRNGGIRHLNSIGDYALKQILRR